MWEITDRTDLAGIWYSTIDTAHTRWSLKRSRSTRPSVEDIVFIWVKWASIELGVPGRATKKKHQLIWSKQTPVLDELRVGNFLQTITLKGPVWSVSRTHRPMCALHINRGQHGMSPPWTCWLGRRNNSLFWRIPETLTRLGICQKVTWSALTLDINEHGVIGWLRSRASYIIRVWRG